MYLKTSKQTILDAMANLSWHYPTVRLEKLEPSGPGWLIRLKAGSYNYPGYSRSFYGRRSPWACWHVWGMFLDLIGKLDSNAQYRDRRGRLRLVWEHGWEDWNIGSTLRPLPASKACDCARFQEAEKDRQDLGEDKYNLSKTLYDKE